MVEDEFDLISDRSRSFFIKAGKKINKLIKKEYKKLKELKENDYLDLMDKK